MEPRRSRDLRGPEPVSGPRWFHRPCVMAVFPLVSRPCGKLVSSRMSVLRIRRQRGPSVPSEFPAGNHLLISVFEEQRPWTSRSKLINYIPLYGTGGDRPVTRRCLWELYVRTVADSVGPCWRAAVYNRRLSPHKTGVTKPIGPVSGRDGPYNLVAHMGARERGGCSPRDAPGRRDP